jgi:hypothetical protein
LRPVEQRQHQEQALALTAAEPGERRSAPLAQAEQVQQAAGVPGPGGRKEIQRLADPQPVRQR